MHPPMTPSSPLCILSPLFLSHCLFCTVTRNSSNYRFIWVKKKAVKIISTAACQEKVYFQVGVNEFSQVSSNSKELLPSENGKDCWNPCSFGWGAIWRKLWGILRGRQITSRDKGKLKYRKGCRKGHRRTTKLNFHYYSVSSSSESTMPFPTTCPQVPELKLVLSMDISAT